METALILSILLIVWFILARRRSSGRQSSTGTYTLSVVGVSHSNPDGSKRQDIIRKLCRPGRHVDLYREPDNPHDENAVGVHVSGKQIGHLSARNAEWVAKIIDQGRPLSATVNAVYGGTRDKPSRGVTITVVKRSP